MQKAATRWVYDQLHSHDNFLMPPIKELHYFNRFGLARTTRLYGGKFNTLLIQAFKKGGEIPEETRREIAFFRRLTLSKVARDVTLEILRDRGEIIRKRDEIARAEGEEFGTRQMMAFYGTENRSEWVREYVRAFQCLNAEPLNGRRVYSGDITPAYGLLPLEAIKLLKRRFRTAKFFMMVRDPVSRLVSHLQMNYRRGTRFQGILDDPDRLREFLKGEDMMLRRAYPSQIYLKWKRVLGDRCEVFFFDDLKADPEKLREDIAYYITGERSGTFHASAFENVKVGHDKVEIPDHTREFLRDFMSSELDRCRRVFGEKAADW